MINSAKNKDSKIIRKLFLLYTTGFLMCGLVSIIEEAEILALLAFIYISVCVLIDYFEWRKQKW